MTPAELTYVQPDLEALGPIVEVGVHMSRDLARILVANNKPVPPPIVVTAIIDTGATFCAFKPEVFEHLGIEPYDVADITTASVAREQRYTYFVDVAFGKRRVPDISAIEAKLELCPAHGLIGRNVLKHVVFTYDGRRNAFTLSF